MIGAFYGRMSDEKQNEKSPEDQLSEARRFCKERKIKLAPHLTFFEPATSGFSRHNRPAFQETMERIDEWEVLIVWDFGRMARNEEDYGWIKNRLRSRKKDAISAKTGLSIFNLGSRVESVLSEEYLYNLGKDTHRGMRRQVERGYWVGSIPYGYTTVADPSGRVDAHMNPIPNGYHLRVDPGKAQVVERIFDMYIAGNGERVIAYQLNAEGTPSPRSRSWAPSGIRSMLLNPIYKGVRVWNRREHIKDHATTTRVVYTRPEAEHVCDENPDWVIIEPERWRAAQVERERRGAKYRRGKGGKLTGRAKGSRRTQVKYLLSGLVECSECGGPFCINSHERMSCLWRKDRGPEVCTSSLRAPRIEIERRVVDGLKRQILIPEVVEYTLQLTLEEMERDIGTSSEREDQAAVDLHTMKIENLVELVADVGPLPEYAEKLRSLKAERARIALRLSHAHTPREVGAYVATIRKRITALDEALLSGGIHARAALQALLGDGRIVIGGTTEEWWIRAALRLSFLPPRASLPPSDVNSTGAVEILLELRA